MSIDNSGSYLMDVGFANDTQVFIKAMSWGNDDPNKSTYFNTLPTGASHIVYLNGEEAINSTFTNWPVKHPSSQAEQRGYWATFLKHDITGWKTGESIKYDTFGTNGNAVASGLLSKLKEQTRDTVLLLTTLDEPYENVSIFKEELKNNWDAELIDNLGYRGSYILVSSRGNGKIYESIATGAGEGPIGFCGWINNKEYNDGFYYADYELSFTNLSELVDPSISGAYLGDMTFQNSNDVFSRQYVGFFKTRESGDYSFRISSDGNGYLWLGNEASSGYSLSNEDIESNSTSYVTGEFNLNGNTYYPIRYIYKNPTIGNWAYTLQHKFENNAFSSNFTDWIYHSNHQKTIEYLTSD
jgi:hypothetical protein